MTFPLFLIPILVGLAVQATKPFLNKQWYADLDAAGHKIPRYGGMPSAHTAFAFSIATTIAMGEGFSGPSFLIAAALVIFVLDDALRMRIFLSRHGLALHKLVAKLPPKDQKEFPYLETRLGHKKLEVLIGAIVGTILTIIIVSLVR